MFLVVLDHGRTINIFATHLIAFILTLKFNDIKFSRLIKNLNSSFIIQSLMFLCLTFYLFMWYIPQGGGYEGIGSFNKDSSIFKSTLLNEVIDLIMIVYNFIDTHIILLPRLVP